MKDDIVKLLTPKGRKGALNQAAFISEQLEIRVQRKANIMSSIKNTELKLKRLEQTLEHYKKQVELVDTDSANFKEALDQLQANFTLTQSEILEVRSELLRHEISKKRAMSGVLDQERQRLT